MGVILGTCFLGVSILASHLQPYRGENDPTGIALMAEYTRRPTRTAPDHPDRHLPRAGARRQHRLRRVPAPRLRSSPRTATCPARWPTAATSWCSPTASSSSPSSPVLLIVVFKGNITALIPLYAFGVFTGFTLSQAGMVVHHFRHKDGRWRGPALINGVGCFAIGRRGAGRGGVEVHGPGRGSRRCSSPCWWFLRSSGATTARCAMPCRPSRGTNPQRHTHTVVVLVGRRAAWVLELPATRVAGAGPADRGVGGDRTGRSRSSSHRPWERFGVADPSCTPSLSPYRG